MTETDLSSLSVEEIFKFLESNNADVVAEVQAMFHQNLSHTKDSWLVGIFGVQITEFFSCLL